MVGSERESDARYRHCWDLCGHCRDCGIDTRVRGADHYYMVRQSVWQQSGLPTLGGQLCLPCLEGRIGRTLRPDDFTAVPINMPGSWHSEILNRRLTGI